MAGGGLEIPAQTITVSSDQLGKELADRLRKSLEGFQVYRATYYVRLMHVPCREILRTTRQADLLELVQLATGHECSPESGSAR